MAVVVVGASQGLGEALCEEFHGRGYPVIAASRNETRLARMSSVLTGLRTFPCDVRDEQSMKGLAEFAATEYNGISTLVFVAGVNFDDVVADWEDTSGFRTVIETNLIGAANALHVCLPQLSAHPNAHVVALTSLAGVIGCVPGGSAYAASKAGLDAFFSSCAPELKALGVKVLIVDPGSMVAPNDSQRQVIGSGTRYRDTRSKEKRGRPVGQVAREIVDAVHKGRTGRMWSTYRIAILGALAVKLFLPSLMERMALRVRFKHSGRLPNRLRRQTDEDEDLRA